MKIWTKGAACLPERYCSQSAKKRRAVKFGIFVQNVHETPGGNNCVNSNAATSKNII